MQQGSEGSLRDLAPEERRIRLRSAKAHTTGPWKNLYKDLGSMDRAKAVDALIAVGPPVVDDLIAVLQDKTRPIEERKAVAYVLGEIGDKRAVEPMIQIVEGFAQGLDKRERTRIEQGLSEDEHTGLFRTVKEALETMGYELIEARQPSPTMELMSNTRAKKWWQFWK